MQHAQKENLISHKFVKTASIINRESQTKITETPL